MAEAIEVSFKFLAVARPGVGRNSEVRGYRVSSGETVGQALGGLSVAHEAEVALLVRGRVVGWDYVLQAGDEVVVVPPLSGG